MSAQKAENNSKTKHTRDIGLALSGGGSRAIAFHLGCLRTLDRMNLLGRVQVISSVSGGSVISGMYAYSDDPFKDFDTRVVKLLRQGLFRKIAAQWIFHPRIFGCIVTFIISGTTALLTNIICGLLGIIKRFVPGMKKIRADEIFQPPFRRWVSRTSALAGALKRYLYKDTRITDKRRNDMDVVINATDLTTGSAFRFGSVESGCYRYGRLVNNNVKISKAVAASAAYPLMLPGLDVKYLIQYTNEEPHKQRFILSDGGIYDNLGISCFSTEKSDKSGYNKFYVKYVICCSAGHGLEDTYARPYWWPYRTVFAFKSIFRKFQDSGYASLFQLKKTASLHASLREITDEIKAKMLKEGVDKRTIDIVIPDSIYDKARKMVEDDPPVIDNFALAYLGKIDDQYRKEIEKRKIVDKRIKEIFNDLVPRDYVKNYPTNFSKMKQEDIDNLTKRGEQEMELWIRIYCRELLPKTEN